MGLNISKAQILTSVTATITDSQGQTWNNGSYSVQFIATPNIPGPFTNQGHSLQGGGLITGSINSSGTLSVTLDDNINGILPSGSKWQFTICPQASVRACSQMIAIVITGSSMNLSTIFSNQVIPPVINPNPVIGYAYSDAEVNTGIGGMYVRTTDSSFRQCVNLTCNGSGFTSISSANWGSPGSIGSVTPNAGVFTHIQGPIGDITPNIGLFTNETITPPQGSYTFLSLSDQWQNQQVGAFGQGTVNTSHFESYSITGNNGNFTFPYLIQGCFWDGTTYSCPGGVATGNESALLFVNANRTEGLNLSSPSYSGGIEAINGVAICFGLSNRGPCRTVEFDLSVGAENAVFNSNAQNGDLNATASIISTTGNYAGGIGTLWTSNNRSASNWQRVAVMQGGWQSGGYGFHLNRDDAGNDNILVLDNLYPTCPSCSAGKPVSIAFSDQNSIKWKITGNTSTGDNLFISDGTVNRINLIAPSSGNGDTQINAAGTASVKFMVGAGTGSIVYFCGNSTNCGTPVANINASGTITTISQIVSTLATGTTPFSITSTTPVTNLTTSPLAYTINGTQVINPHIVVWSCILGTSCNITLSGSAVYTNSSTYYCSGFDNNSAAAIKFVPSSGSAFALTGTGTDTLNGFCIGT